MNLQDINTRLAAISNRLWAVRSGGDTVILYREAAAPTGVNPFVGPIASARRPGLAWKLFEARRALYGFALLALLLGCTHPPTRSQVLEQVRGCINAPGAVGLLRDIVDDCTSDVVVVGDVRAECLDEFEMYTHADSLKADARCERVGR